VLLYRELHGLRFFPTLVDGDEGKEVVIVYSADSVKDSEGVFWTDANGRQLLKRQRNFRSSFDVDPLDFEEHPVASNYYPLGSTIYLESASNDAQMSVLVDRSQGGGSINDGEIEIMVHRLVTIQIKVLNHASQSRFTSKRFYIIKFFECSLL
jgi:hypothetical protein